MRAASIVLLMASLSLQAQRFQFKFYGEEEGLQNLAVQVVLQDRAGFLWAGTQNGLYRYDGSRFTGFSKREGLPGDRIEALHESMDGTLWVGTQNGLAKRVGDRFEAVPLDAALSVPGIASDAAGQLYVATERGLFVGRPEHWKLIGGAAAVSVYVDGAGTVWYGCGKSLCRIEGGQGHEGGIDAGPLAGLPAERWDAILGDIEGNLWVRSEQSLYVRGNGSHRFQLRPGLPATTNVTPTLALDPAGRLLVPTSRGLARETASGWELVEAQQGLTTNDVASVMQDREGSIWLGLAGSGLARWLGYNEWRSWTDHEGLSRESIWSMARDTGGRLWVGTQFGLNYADDRKGSLVWRRQELPGLEMIRTLAAAPDGTLWIGASPGGLRQLNPRTGQLTSFGAGDGLTSDAVRHVTVDRQGSVWVSTHGGLFHRAAGSRRFEPVAIGEGPAEPFYMTAVDREGAVWAGGGRGLARFSNGKWKRFTTYDGLKSDVVAHIVAEDGDGAIWVSYYDTFGVSRLTFPRGELKLEHFGSGSGLSSDKSLFLGFDARGKLWAGSDRGVDVFDGTRWRHYGRSDGLIWDDCNTNAFLAEPDGKIWVGTSRGLSQYEPASPPLAGVPPPVMFTSVKFGDQMADVSASMGDVPYARRSLQVRFGALTFVQEAHVLFRYRLAPVQSEWLETTQRELNYPELRAGPYTLEVMARNAQGVWSAEPARMSFQIMTPWWLTWWFRLAAGSLAVVLARALWQRRTYRSAAERHRLEIAVAKRTHELLLEKQLVTEEKARTEQQKVEIERLFEESQEASRLKSEFLANMSHELRTPMNGIIGMTDLVLATPLTEEQREFLRTARLSANSLLTILNSVLDFSKIEAGKMDLSPIDFSFRECVYFTAKVFSVAAAEKGLNLEVRIHESIPERVIGDPDRLRQVLLNLIGNAIKFTASGGVFVTVEPGARSSDKIRLDFAVRDTGIGIPGEKQELIFEAFRQADGSTTRQYGGTGLGLAISQRLVELMGGSMRVESSFGHGSVFKFSADFLVAPNIDRSGDSPDVSILQYNLVAANERPAPVQEPVGPLNVLLAEDNIINQRVAMRLLEKRGHRVALATTGHQALEWMERERFDVIVMDVQMPGLGGIEATAIIRAQEQNSGGYTPIIALTARTIAGDRERCLEAGMDTYINKPIDALPFLEAVEATAGLVRR